MKKWLLIVFIFYSICYSSEYIEVVHLNNGDVIKGVIIENVINDFIKIEIQGGSILTLRYSDVEKISKEVVEKEVKKQSAISNRSQFDSQKMMMYQTQKKSESTAMLFSLLIPSAGHAYAGNWERGLGFAAAEVGLYIMALTMGMEEVCDDYYGDGSCWNSYYEPNTLFWMGVFGAIGTRFYEIFDAGKEVKNYNQRLLMQYGMEPGLSMNIIPQTKGASLQLAYNF